MALWFKGGLRVGQGRSSVQQLRCCSGCRHSVSECLASISGSASYPSFLLLWQPGRQRVMAQVAGSPPPEWETGVEFLALGIWGVNQQMVHHLYLYPCVLNKINTFFFKGRFESQMV